MNNDREQYLQGGEKGLHPKTLCTVVKILASIEVKGRQSRRPKNSENIIPIAV